MQSQLWSNVDPSDSRARLRVNLEHWAAQGIFLGTSSWKYPVWIGSIYANSAYQFRGAFSEHRFQQRCLGEYAALLPTVGVDAFLARLPGGWRYAVEIRNRNLLHPELLACLARRGVAYTFNLWSNGLALETQLQTPGTWSAPFAGARLLTRPGTNYEARVRQLSLKPGCPSRLGHGRR